MVCVEVGSRVLLGTESDRGPPGTPERGEATSHEENQEKEAQEKGSKKQGPRVGIGKARCLVKRNAH